MALKRLRTEEMVTITSTLVDPAHPDYQAMVAVPDVAEGAPAPGQALAARNRWIRTMQTVRDVAALVASDNPAISEIMARLDGAERAADRRVGSGAGDEVEAPDIGGDFVAPAGARETPASAVQ